MKIKATFRGENGSMGFRTGEEYELEVFADSPKSSQIVVFLYTPSKPTRPLCPYTNIEYFLRNWSNISKK